jgi:hypothetical protein
MTTFNIGSQNAGSIQNVGGDMLVEHGIHGAANVHVVELRERLADLQREVERVPLPPEVRAAANQALADAEAEAAAPEPRSNRIGDNLRRATKALGDAGALTSAGVGLAKALACAVSVVNRLA